MSFASWEPLRNLAASQDRLHRLFHDAFGTAFPNGTGDHAHARTWTPAVDIYEAEGDLIAKVEIPGVNPNEVEVRVEQNTLFLRGERKLEKERNYHRVERSYGSFARSFALPRSVDADKIAAEYKDGVLTITMPKREEAKPKAVKINVAVQ